LWSGKFLKSTVSFKGKGERGGREKKKNVPPEASHFLPVSREETREEKGNWGDLVPGKARTKHLQTGGEGRGKGRQIRKIQVFPEKGTKSLPQKKEKHGSRPEGGGGSLVKKKNLYKKISATAI